MSPDRSCHFCGNPGMKRRIQVTNMKTTCIYVCGACWPRMEEAILEIRAAWEARHARTT